jgi:hypothetical protein
MDNAKPSEHPMWAAQEPVSTRHVFSRIIEAIPDGAGIAEHERTTLSTMTSDEPRHHDVEMALR